MESLEVPTITVGLRGLSYLEVTLQGPNRDLHSGSFGGAVRNPAQALAALIAELRDPNNGEIRIPGFYDDVRPLEEWERADLDAWAGSFEVPDAEELAHFDPPRGTDREARQIVDTALSASPRSEVAGRGRPTLVLFCGPPGSGSTRNRWKAITPGSVSRNSKTSC